VILLANIEYISTRGNDKAIGAAETIILGIAADGGLFVPRCFPAPITDLKRLVNLSYQDLAYEVMQLFLTDFTETELRSCITNAYDDKFTTPTIAPLTNKAGVHFLELYHGPTLAFKDMALTILPYLLKTAAKKLNQDAEIVILTATSGDTGKAALEGFAGVAGTKIIVFFPEHGVSEIQKRQMITQTGANTHVIGIEGNFDDAQSGVKAIFTDPELIRKLAAANKMFSSANSINIGRLIPQVVYYFYAYTQLCRSGAISCGDQVNFAVPTGNFGNILAGYYAQQIGLPIKKLICASNDNKVLYDFFNTGTYDRNREFVTTISPSMDILISSNLERLLFDICGQDGNKTRTLMEQLQKAGKYSITTEMATKLHSFYGGFTSEADTYRTIKDVFEKTHYLLDTHTAVAYAVSQAYREETKDTTPMVVVSTASPYKFTRAVMTALDKKYADSDEYQLIAEMADLLQEEPPLAIRDLDKRPILHRTVCQKKEMKPLLERLLLNS
jgi:threonine synthase